MAKSQWLNSFEAAIREYLFNNDYDSIVDQSLIKEMKDWADDWSKQQKGSKALRLYVRCMLVSKIELAKKIKDKYGRDFPNSDRTIAMMYSLINHKKKQ